ncbi:MAG: type I 3-dehydroquinate dehydratase [Treponema sp.]|jgi:3-dehydroquinate dehydratase/shikimate dehydrogenase|nr:type I 3-dehydroquinate dehydratase [Treponema sp.]
MAKLCLCLTAKTLARDLEILEKYRRHVDMAELRVDCLEPDERFFIRHFPGRAGMPVILTVRREKDGGKYVGGEGARIRLLSEGIAFAEADRRQNFAYVDLEEDLNVPSLEEAARTFGTRIIRSWHDFSGIGEDVAGKIRRLCRTGDELVKVAVMPQGSEDLLRVVKAARETKDVDKILLCMGHYGVFTRILAEKLGSQIGFTTAFNEDGASIAGPGQLDPREMVELYRFRKITADTLVFGVTGFPLTVSDSPRFFNTIFGIEETDAAYVPFPADSVPALIKLAEELDVQGLSVTVPYKEKVLPVLAHQSQEVEAVGACNTLVRSPQGWAGYNTDIQGFSDSLLEFIGKKSLKGKKITIIGAGGAARAVTAGIFRLAGKALVLNRTLARARELAHPYRFLWGGLDKEGVANMAKHSDIIIQTTPVGMKGNPASDPLEMYEFSGKEMVMDLVYKPEITPFLNRAQAAGCPILNGYDMLIRQARYQYTLFLKKEFPPNLLNRVKF